MGQLDEASAERISNELQSMGIAVERLQSGGQPDAQASLDEADLAAIITIDPDRGDVHVLVRAGGRHELRAASFHLGTTDNERTTALLSAMEFLRACLLDVPSGPAPRPPRRIRPEPRPELQHAPSRAPLAPPEISPPPHARFELGAGPALLHSGGGGGTSRLVEATARLKPSPRASLFAAVWVPFVASAIEQPEGRASVFPTLLSIGATASPWLSEPVELFVGGGLAAAVLSMRTNANPGFSATDAVRWTAVPNSQAGASIKLGGRMRLRFSAMAGIAASQPRITFVGRDVGGWGSFVTGADTVLLLEWE